MKLHRPLAFVDLETTGLGPGAHRIAEIGIVTLDGDGALEEWTSLVNPGRYHAVEGVPEEAFQSAPRFADVAHDVERRLRGRLLVAHNARFDYAFLKAEFERAGSPFDAQALCTVMLSRKLYPRHAGHNLDAVAARHGLVAGVRHRALPDAQLLHQFWQAIANDFPARSIWAAVDKLLAEPLLPPHLDLGLVHALPEKPGVYLLRGANGEVLRIGRAANLRREVKDYFRLDRISGSAAKISCELRNIEWRVSEGSLSARLDEIGLKEKELGSLPAPSWTIRVDPARIPIAQVIAADEMVSRGEALFGIFPSERKAANALARVATRKDLCAALVGLDKARCVLCAAGDCTAQRRQHLVQALTALSSLRLQPWPYAGPVGVREGRTVHVFDDWQWLGSAKTSAEVAELAHLRPRSFHHAIFAMLTKELRRLSARHVRTLRQPDAREARRGIAYLAARLNPP
jgi:DNA polymerase-3 subunit epsilon